MNELLTVEINSKNRDKLIDLLNESNLIVEILPRAKQTVVRTNQPIDVVCLTTEYAGDLTITTDVKSPYTQQEFNYNISETV